MGCQRKQRTCADCGDTFQGHTVQCWKCRWAALPFEVRTAMARSTRNARRARQQQNEIAGPVPAAVYAAIKAEALCVYCGAEADEVDHIRPVSLAGPERVSNLVPACGTCNRSKADKLLTEWIPARVHQGVLADRKVAAEYVREIKLKIEPRELEAV
ncbi:HNH endonuclease [Streptomyces sp. H27-G5]|uniref:HNH endonuclease n=1 Tax=Streptomyces sp. H27-G5 TaxID=2996698 RepID=UPI00226DA2B6|nr:HNH endonuclease [Streptomyces sp. H27-G5]MCY0922863.1 HNH endonuclease [Streptomyces sp. H27-G5]